MNEVKYMNNYESQRNGIYIKSKNYINYTNTNKDELLQYAINYKFLT